MRRRAAYYLAKMEKAPTEPLDLSGATIQPCVGVFNPWVSSSTAHICRWISERVVPTSVLDVGTGTGAIGVVAALRGCPTVVMIDSNPTAVECASANVVRNNVSARCRVQQLSNTQLLHGTFQTVIFAAPYLWFAPTARLRQRYGPLVDAMFDEADKAKIAVIDDAPRLLEPNGQLIIQIGSISRKTVILEAADRVGLQVRNVDSSPDGQEEHLVFEFLKST